MSQKVYKEYLKNPLDGISSSDTIFEILNISTAQLHFQKRCYKKQLLEFLQDNLLLKMEVDDKVSYGSPIPPSKKKLFKYNTKKKKKNPLIGLLLFICRNNTQLC